MEKNTLKTGVVTKMPEALKREIFEYLDELRDSGKTNMFGAAPYIVANFFLSKREARQVLMEWMNNKDKESNNEKCKA